MESVTSAVGFTAVLCDDCQGLPALDALRETVRRTPHGVLVRAPCQLGKLWCSTRTKASGASGTVVLVQPCDVERRPTGPVIPVGPIRTRTDLAALTGWMTATPLTADSLPARLRTRVPSAQARNN